jgi:polysaccharide chain length determinant protein (PEP-CTERM system associated)
VIPGKLYTPEVLLRIAWRRRWLIILPAIAIATTVAGVTYRLPNRYRSDTLILVVPQRVPESYVRSTVTTRIEDRLQSISQQILSRSRLERIIQDFDLYPDRRRTAIMEDVVDGMRSDIQVQVVKGDAFSVSYAASEPRTAMRVTERLASLFIDESLRDREQLAEGTNQFLESQLEETKRQLIDNEKKLEAYRRRHDGELPSQVDANLQGLHNAQMQLQALTDSMNRDRDRRLVLERILADADTVPDSNPPSTAHVTPGDAQPSGGTAADQLSAAEAVLQAMQLKLTPEHPDVVRMKRTIVELQRRAEAEAAARPVSEPPVPLKAGEVARRNRVKEAQGEIDNIDRQILAKLSDEKRLREELAEYQKRIEAAPTRENELIELTRDYDTLQHLYRDLLSKKEDSQISANLERRQIGEQFKILDPARLPQRPTSPDRPRLYLLGIAAALGVGLGLAAVLEYFDRTMRSEEDVRTALNLLVLATVPVLPGLEASKGHHRRVVAVSVTVGAAVVLSAVAVAWRLLR